MLAAIDNEYGDVHRTERTEGSTLWINPLMAMYWSFQLDVVAQRLLYLERIQASETYVELANAIGYYRAELRRDDRIKEWQSIPV